MQYSTFCGQKLCPNNSLIFVYYFVNLGASSTLKLFLYPTVVYRIWCYGQRKKGERRGKSGLDTSRWKLPAATFCLLCEQNLNKYIYISNGWDIASSRAFVIMLKISIINPGWMSFTRQIFTLISYFAINNKLEWKFSFPSIPYVRLFY